MDKIRAAMDRLNRNRPLYANLLEVLRRGSGTLLYAGPDGLLLYDGPSEAYMMTAEDETTSRRLLDLLPEDCSLFVGHELFYLTQVQNRFGFTTTQICHSALWEGMSPMPEPPFSGELRRLTPEWAETVERHYHASFGGVPYMESAIHRGMVGAFLHGVLAGFVGFHEEGSIGMLEVLPAYRRQGLGAVLQTAAVNLALSQGRYAFGQIFDDNLASLALQRRLGMTVSHEKMFWIF